LHEAAEIAEKGVKLRIESFLRNFFFCLLCFSSDSKVSKDNCILKAAFVPRKKEFLVKGIGIKSIFILSGLEKRWPSSNRRTMLNG